jgi:hypothetical protein
MTSVPRWDWIEVLSAVGSLETVKIVPLLFLATQIGEGGKWIEGGEWSEVNSVEGENEVK